jgi:hypothetical protein
MTQSKQLSLNNLTFIVLDKVKDDSDGCQDTYITWRQLIVWREKWEISAP